MREFEGRVAVVTGAASGIGRALAERCAQEGMRVVLADYEEKALAATVAEIKQRELDVTGIVADVSRPESVENLAKQAIDTFGKVHVLCNNAGVLVESELGRLRGGPSPALWEHPLSDWQWTFGVNFWGVIHGIHAFVPRMLAHGEPGHIVNTASIAGLTSGAGLPIYGASKHAVVRVSEALQAQLQASGANLNASVLCPGGVDTRIYMASRNRPTELRDDGEQPAPEELEAIERAWEERPAPAGMAPAEVAERVFAAIKEEQFYILTHDEFDGAIRARTDRILERRNPGAGDF